MANLACSQLVGEKLQRWAHANEALLMLDKR